ncbi:MAG: PadR family transcriptional regulator [Firmicutes bacterium]|nr:PadR family transcriptional regulator [Bacillota bacterium]
MAVKNGEDISLDKLIQPGLLLFVYMKPSHGYELIQNYNKLQSTEEVEPGTIYRNLRRMEKNGLLTSSWQTSESGPARRLYEITEKGINVLDEAAAKVEKQKLQVEQFLSLYREQKEQGGSADEK